MSEPQRTISESYRDLVERVVAAKAREPFDPLVWRAVKGTDGPVRLRRGAGRLRRRHLRVETTRPRPRSGAVVKNQGPLFHLTICWP
jgi:hypothetical protein